MPAVPISSRNGRTARRWAISRIVRASALAFIVAACGGGGSAVSDAGLSAHPKACGSATDCASCLQADGELCLWCNATATCQSYPAPCAQGTGNHGYFVESPLYPTPTASEATAVCALSCAAYGELLATVSGASLDPEACCSSSLLTEGENGSSCPVSNAGEGCAVDADCVTPETCSAGVCVGEPDQQQLICTSDGTTSCGCQIETLPPDAGSLACGTSAIPNSVCCATEGWPNPVPGSGANCGCWSAPCSQISGNVGGPGNCACGPNYADSPPQFAISSCTGQLCCASSLGSICECFATIESGDTCASRAGPTLYEVSSCAAAAITCQPPGGPAGADGYHTVSSCNTGQ